MSMSYEARQMGNVTVLDVRGRIDVGTALAFEGMSLQEVVRDFAKRGHTRIVLNLQEVSYVDSSGLGDLVGSAVTVRKLGGDLIIVNPGMQVKKLLHMTTLHPFVLDVKNDEASALEAFAKGATRGGTSAA